MIWLQDGAFRPYLSPSSNPIWQPENRNALKSAWIQDISACITTTNEIAPATPHFRSRPIQVWNCRHGRRRPTSGIQNVRHQPEVEITFERNRWQSDSSGYTHISNMPDLNMTLPTRPDIGQHRKLTSRPRHLKWKPEVEITLNENRWQSDSNGYTHIFDHVRLRCGTADTAWHRLTSETQMLVTKPEVETGSRNNFWTETDGKAIPTATPTFSTMPDLDRTLPTRPDIGQHRKFKCRPRNRKWKPEVEISFEKKQVTKRFQRLHPNFRLRPTQVWHCRHGLTSAYIGNSNVATKPEVETGNSNNFLNENWWRCDSNGYPHIFLIWVARSRKYWIGVGIASPSSSVQSCFYFRFGGRHFEFRMSDRVVSTMSESGVFANVGVAVGRSFPSPSVHKLSLILFSTCRFSSVKPNFWYFRSVKTRDDDVIL